MFKLSNKDQLSIVDDDDTDNESPTQLYEQGLDIHDKKY